MQPGSHGSTFGGNPVACAVARVVLKRMSQASLMARVQAVSARIVARLQAFGEARQMFSEVRAAGLLVGAQLREPFSGKAGAVMSAGAEHGVLALVAGPDVVRLLPPLNISDEELEAGMTRLEAALTEVADGA